MIFSRLISSATSVLGAVFIAGLVLATPAGAVDAESLTLSPVSKPYKVDAGSTTQDSFTVINDGNTEYDFIVYAAPYSVSNYTYDPNFTTLKDNTDAFQWVQFEKTSWTLKPGDRVDIPYTVRVPNDAAPGGHYGILFAETQPKEADSTQILRKKRVGVMLRTTVNGNYTVAGKHVGTTINWLQFGAPLQAKTQVENTGNTDFQSQTTFRAQDLFGNVRYEKASDNIVYPKTIRDVESTWDNAAWFGIYKASVETKVLDEVNRSQSYVLVAPKWLLVVLVVALIGGIYGAIVSRKHRR